MLEYVPMITPRIIVKAKGSITSPPKINKLNKASKVVILVMIVLDKVLLIDLLNRSIRSNFLYLRKFSLTRSKITTLSFTEYPTIVSIAAIEERLKSMLRIDNIPKVINTS